MARSSNSPPDPTAALPTTALALLLLLVVAAFAPGLEQPGKAVREALLLVAAPLLLGLSAWRARSRPGVLFVALVALVMAAGLLGVALVPRPETLAVARDLAVLLAPWLVASAAAMLPGPDGGKDAENRLEQAVIVALFLVGLAGLAQAFWSWSGLEQSWPPAATFVNRNVAAQCLVALIPLVLPALLAGRSGVTRWGAALSGGIGIAFLIATRSRGGWLGVVVGCGLGAVLLVLYARRSSRRPPFRGAAAPAALLGVLCLIGALVPGRGPESLASVPERLGTLARPAAAVGGTRVALWRNTAVLAADAPLAGIGAGRFAVEYPRYQAARVETPNFGTVSQPEHPHNDALEFAAELGLPSAMALAGLLLGAMLISSRRAVQADSWEQAARCAARVAAIGGVLVHGLVSFPLHSPASALLIAVVVGRSWRRTGGGRGHPSWRKTVAVLALLAVPFAVWVGLRELRAQAAMGRAIRSHAAGACADALEAARNAERNAPWSRRLVGMAAMVHFECDPDPGRTLGVLEPALAMNPHRLELLLAVGARRLKVGRAREASTAFAHAVEIAPRLSRTWLGLAMAQGALGDDAGARASCGTALEIAPRLEPARAFCEGNGYVRPGG